MDMQTATNLLSAHIPNVESPSSQTYSIQSSINDLGSAVSPAHIHTVYHSQRSRTKGFFCVHNLHIAHLNYTLPAESACLCFRAKCKIPFLFISLAKIRRADHQVFFETTGGLKSGYSRVGRRPESSRRRLQRFQLSLGLL